VSHLPLPRFAWTDVCAILLTLFRPLRYPGLLVKKASFPAIFCLTVCSVLLAGSPVHAQEPAPGDCINQDGSIDIPRAENSTVILKVEDLSTLYGEYCRESIGYHKASNVERSDLSCTVTVSPLSGFSMQVGGKTIQFNPNPKTLATTIPSHGTTPASRNYSVNFGTTENVTGGTEHIYAELEIQAKRLVYANLVRTRQVNGVAEQLERMACAFHRTSEVNTMVVGALYFASSDNVAPELVGTHLGSVETTLDGEPIRRACTLQITSTGEFTLGTYAASRRENARITANGRLEGKYMDRFIYHDGKLMLYPVQRGDPWPGGASIKGIGLSLDSGLQPSSAIGWTSDDSQDMETVGKCDFGIPPDLPPTRGECDGEACYAEKGGVGQMSCQAAVGNPIHAANGNKFQRELDFEGAGSVNLRFERFYNSHWSAASGSVGTNWRTNFDRTLLINITQGVIRAQRADGKVIVFTKMGEVWRRGAEHGSDLRPIAAGGPIPDAAWMLTEGEETEIYNTAGKLIRTSAPGGNLQNLHYDVSGRLKKVVDRFGHELNFTYNGASRIDTMRDPAGGEFIYKYDELGNLIAVEAPGSPQRTQRKYLYENAEFPHALTGIEDEDGVLFASWKYDSKGRAYLSEHAGGANRTELVFGDDKTTTVIDALGTERTVFFETILGVSRYAGESQPAGAGCDAASKYVWFDANGNAAVTTDFKNVSTTHTYDLTRNLETSRVEAQGTALARTFRTRWHPTLDIVSSIAAPKLITTYDLDHVGKIQSVIEQATTDLTGASGFDATKVGPPRKWTYTYNPAEQLESIDGPRTDLNDVTRFTYELATGNLETSTNALGHVTRYSNYDLLGRPRRIVGPNNVATDITYNPRGWITSRSISVQGKTLTTQYRYSGYGQLKKIILPNGAFIDATYDDAHRLTSVSDNLNNSIHYTLDLLGNRKKEEMKDPGGVLTRQVSREFDALNRVQKQTGVAQ
jgi:YD repeat-containing protein